MANQIRLVGGFRQEEAVGSGAISPGMLLELTSDGEVQAHSEEGGVAERLIATEDALQGKTVSDSYADGARVQFHVADPGAEYQMLLKAGEDVVIGEHLVSAGDGTLISESSVGSEVVTPHVVAVACEAEDLSGSGAEDTLITVRLM